MSEVGNQLKSQTLGDVEAQSFNIVGGRVFPDINATTDFMDLVAIVEAYRATHNPNYGTHIPNSAKVDFQEGTAGLTKFKDNARGTGTNDLFQDKKTYKVMAVDVTNLGLAAITVDFGVANANGDFVKISSTSPGSGAQVSVDIKELTTFDSSVQPAFIVSSGFPADAFVQIAYAELTQ